MKEKNSNELTKGFRLLLIFTAVFIGGQMIRPFFQHGVKETISDPSVVLLVFIEIVCLVIVFHNLKKILEKKEKAVENNETVQ